MSQFNGKCPSCGASRIGMESRCRYCDTLLSVPKAEEHVYRIVDESASTKAAVRMKELQLRERALALEEKRLHVKQRQLDAAQPRAKTAAVQNAAPANTRSKWASFFLCLFFGVIGVHKFYEGKPFMGLLYLFTGGLLGLGWFIDTLVLLFKPNPYVP